MVATKILPGTIATIAGNGEPGHAGDNGSATGACLNEPKGLALGSNGILYIADAENHVVRKVDLASGLITTVAGQPEKDTGASGPARAEAPPEDEDPLADPPAGKAGPRSTALPAPGW